MEANSQNGQKPYAIVAGLDSVQGLQAARTLADRGVPVIGIAGEAKHFACRAKACKKVILTNIFTENLIETLEALGKTLAQKALLIPCEDLIVLLVSRHRDRLAAWYHIALPEANTVDLLMDKVRFYQYAQQNGLPIPTTFFLNSRKDAEYAAKNLHFPCILKPAIKSQLWVENTKLKAFKAENPQELLTFYDNYKQFDEILIAQNYVEGPETNLYSCIGYFDAAANPVVTFTAHKLRQWPPQTGQTCFGEGCQNPEVSQEMVQLFQNLDFHGLGYLEMKRDERSGNYFIIEPNIGRPTGPSSIAEANNVELLYSMYCDKIGEPLPEKLNQKDDSTKWIYLRKDFQAFLQQWHKGELSLWRWLKSLRGRKKYAVFTWRDLSPFFSDLLNALKLILTTKERKKRDYHNIATDNTNSISENKTFSVETEQVNRNKKRVSMIVFSKFPQDVRVRRESEALIDAGYEVDVVCLKGEGQLKEEKTDGVNLYRINIQRKRSGKLRYLWEYGFFTIAAFLKISYLHLKERYQIIHVHNIPDFLVFSALIPKISGAKIILDMHEIMPEFYMRKYQLAENHLIIRLLRYVERFAVRFADRVLIASPLFREKVINRSSPPEKCFTILNFPDTKYFNGRIKDQRNDNKFKIIYPGTLSEIHGVDIAIKAVQTCALENRLPVEFHIYGCGSKQEETKLLDMVNDFKLQNYVFFHNGVSIERMGEILKTMDIGLVPKRGGVFAEDAISTKLFEFAAVGLPAIVSRTKSDALYFDDSMVQFFEPEDAVELADCITNLYWNPQLRQSMAKNSRLVFQTLNWSVIKQDLYEAYDNLTTEPELKEETDVYISA